MSNSEKQGWVNKSVINWEIPTYEKLPRKTFNQLSFCIL
jgi:hypothetical protein